MPHLLNPPAEKYDLSFVIPSFREWTGISRTLVRICRLISKAAEQKMKDRIGIFVVINGPPISDKTSRNAFKSNYRTFEFLSEIIGKSVSVTLSDWASRRWRQLSLSAQFLQKYSDRIHIIDAFQGEQALVDCNITKARHIGWMVAYEHFSDPSKAYMVTTDADTIAWWDYLNGVATAREKGHLIATGEVKAWKSAGTISQRDVDREIIRMTGNAINYRVFLNLPEQTDDHNWPQSSFPSALGSNTLIRGDLYQAIRWHIWHAHEGTQDMKWWEDTLLGLRAFRAWCAPVWVKGLSVRTSDRMDIRNSCWHAHHFRKIEQWDIILESPRSIEVHFRVDEELRSLPQGYSRQDFFEALEQVFAKYSISLTDVDKQTIWQPWESFTDVEWLMAPDHPICAEVIQRVIKDTFPDITLDEAVEYMIDQINLSPYVSWPEALYTPGSLWKSSKEVFYMHIQALHAYEDFQRHIQQHSSDPDIEVLRPAIELFRESFACMLELISIWCLSDDFAKKHEDELDPIRESSPKKMTTALKSFDAVVPYLQEWKDTLADHELYHNLIQTQWAMKIFFDIIWKEMVVWNKTREK